MRIGSVKYDLGWFHHFGNIPVCTYTNLEGTVYRTPRPCCKSSRSLTKMLVHDCNSFSYTACGILGNAQIPCEHACSKWICVSSIAILINGKSFWLAIAMLTESLPPQSSHTSHYSWKQITSNFPHPYIQLEWSLIKYIHR